MMTSKEWGIAYPGNDPRVYEQGLYEMKQSFKNNLTRTEERLREEETESNSAHEG